VRRLLALAALLVIFAAAPIAALGQTYDINSPTPSSIPVVGPAIVVTVTSMNVPPPATVQVCFYVSSESATSVPLAIQTAAASNLVSFTVPASYLNGIPPADLQPYDQAVIYYVPTGSTCTGTVDPAFSGLTGNLIYAPSFSAASTVMLSQTNTAATNPKSVKFTVNGYYFVPKTIVQFTGLPGGTVNATTKYINSNTLVVTSPTIHASATSAGLQVETVGPSGNYLAMTQGTINFYVPKQGLVSAASLAPNPAAAGTSLAITASTTDSVSDPSPQLGGVPTGPIVFSATQSGSQVGSTVSGTLTINPTSTSFATPVGVTDANNVTGTFNAAIADVNGDGLPDAILSSGKNSFNFLVVYPGAYPLGTFAAPMMTTLPGVCESVVSITAGDVNGDGLADAVVVCVDATTGLNDYDVMLSNGDGTFTFAETVDSGTAQVLALGDFYHHGKVDLAAIGLNSGGTGTQITTYSGNGNGTFGPAVISTIGGILDNGRNPSGTTAADMNGDGYSDLVVSDNTQIGVLISNGDGTVGTPAGAANFTYSGTLELTSLAVGDVNKDGLKDIIATAITTSNIPGYIYALLNTTVAGTVSFAAPVVSTIAGSVYGPMAIADFDGDGVQDVLVPVPSSAGAGPQSLIVYSGNNTGAFAQSDTTLQAAVPAASINLLALGAIDLDGDGASDVIYVTDLEASMESYSINGLLVTGTASATTVGNPNLPIGSYTANFTYNGDSIYTGGGTVTLSPLTIVGETTGLGLALSLSGTTYGQTASLTATVIQAVPTADPPTGNVIFSVGTTTLGSVPLSGGQATLNGVQLPAGSDTVVATYGGDTYNASSSNSAPVNISPAVLTVTANTLSVQQGSAVPTLTYSITGFQYTDTQANATTGAPVLSTTATSSSPAGMYPITITQGTLAAANYTFNFVNGTLTVTPAALGITTTVLPVGMVKTAYTSTLAATGGVAPYTWSVTAGALPAGLSLNAASGVISGKPTSPGVSSFTVSVADSESMPMTATAALSIAVDTLEVVLHSFCTSGAATCPDGANPLSGLVLAHDGNYYGTTSQGGANAGGTAFRLTPGGVLSVVYSFCAQASCPDGKEPYGGLVQGTDGNLYGTTEFGGANTYGTVFQLTPAGVLTTLYSFTNGNDGGNPVAQLVQGGDGNFYGTTSSGGTFSVNNCQTNCGTVFEITPAAVLTTLHNFCSAANCADGFAAGGALLQGSDGNFYGTTLFGGLANANCTVEGTCGTLFQITTKGVFSTIYEFCSQANCADGAEPVAGLVEGSDGNFYGNTAAVGAGQGGTVFDISPARSLTTLYSFCSQTNCLDGTGPGAPLFLASDGNFYGTTTNGGGGSDQGTAFEVTPAGVESTLYDFCSLTGCIDGQNPNTLLQGNDGNFYGTTSAGGGSAGTPSTGGLAFELLPPAPLAAPVQLTLSASSVIVGNPVTLTYKVLNAFSTTMQQCAAFVQNPGAGNWTGLQSGTLASGVYSGSTTVTPTAAGTYTYALTCGGIESGFSAPLTVAAAAPTLSSIAPNTAVAGSGATTITLTGTNFNSSDTARVNQAAITTTYNMAKGTLTAVIPAGDLSTPGTLAITVDYVPTGAISNALPFTVTADPTTIALTSSVSAPTYGTPISLTATITPQNADGASTAAVTFYDGTTKLGTVASSGFSATLTGVELSAGAHTLSAVFAGDTIYQASTGTDSLTVAKAVLTVTANNLSKQQGQANPTLTYAITRFKYTDTQANSTTGAPTLSTTATQSSPAGTYPITVTQGTLAAANYTFNFVNGTLTVGATTQLPVGSTSATQTATLTFTAAGAAAAINVLTLGAPNLDFKLVTGGTCAAGTTYDVGAACTADYTFTPAHPGQRLGGITVTDASNNVLANAYITGIGTGPQITFSSANNQTTLVTVPADEPFGVAVDASGDIFFADAESNAVDKVPAGCTTAACVTTLGGGFTSTEGVAVDGSGNVFVVGPGNSQVNEVSPACTNADCVAIVGGGFDLPVSVAVDGVGNVYVADDGEKNGGENAVKEIPAGCAASTCVSTLGGGFNLPGGVAVDGAGNVYVGTLGAAGTSSVSEIPLGCTSAACVITLGGGFDGPNAVAVDASGTVFVADRGNQAVKSIPPGCTSAACVTTLPGMGSYVALNGIAIDGAGNLFVSDGSAGSISKLDFADAPALTFAATAVGSTSAAQTVTLADDGTSALTFTGLATSNANFTLNGSSCTATGTLAAAGACIVGIEFTPQSAGPQSGQVKATDNNLNSAGSTQRIQLTGAGGSVAPTVSVSSVTVPAGSTTSVTVTAAESGTAGAATGGVVTFSVVSPATGSFSPATCTLSAAGSCTSTYTPTGTLAAGSYANGIMAAFAAVGNYTAATAASTLTVTPSQSQFTLTSVSPNTANIGAATTAITLTGTGFTAADQAQVNGTSIATTYVNATTLTAKIPASDLAAPSTLEISVFDASAKASTNALPFTVVVPPVSIVFTGPSTAPSGAQPILTFTLTNPYPVELTATLTLAFAGANGADDPAIEFANGSRTFTFNIAANSTATPTIQLQTGTDEGTITVTLALAITSTGQDVTPAGLAPVDITIPAAVPVITSMTLTRSGNTITVNIMGYSNPRDMASANFTFTGTGGVSIDDPNLTVPATTLFGGWYSTAPSQAFGSEFLYTQAFTLTDDNSTIGQVMVTLTNSAGISGSAAAQ
jgi:uncharacterized repeat protein (TIGR03803 family)